MSESKMPDMPSGPRTVADMGSGILELRTELETLTKTDVPVEYVNLYSMVLTVAEGLAEKGLQKTGERISKLALRNLRLRVSVKGKRIQQFLTPIELELHKEQRKSEEKPKI